MNGIQQARQRFRQQRLPEPVGQSSECCFAHNSTPLLVSPKIYAKTLVVVMNRHCQHF
ncbi:hypothetical protein KCP78_00765 [Salmonella enterica subsp. enterica]|nr:hypothetical protein KCP78_00765 [Salmonella enterica subsp. enterica]